MRLFILILSLIFFSACANTPEKLVGKYGGSVLQLKNEQHYNCSTFYLGHDIFLTDEHCITRTRTSRIILTNKLETETRPAYVVATDAGNDLALLLSEGWDIEPLPLEPDEDLPQGAQILGMGYPGYLGLTFSFEVGYALKETIVPGMGNFYYIAKSICYPGESGGPVFDVETGKVIGVIDAVKEQIELVGPEKIPQHNTISLITPSPYAFNLLEDYATKNNIKL